MHISEGVLSGPVLVAGAVVALGGTVVGMKKLALDQVPQAGMLAAAFFVASLIHVPVGPSSVHLILNGIVGLLLGWAAFPAILTALLLQAMLFQYGGITTLGVNTVIMALPALVCYCLFGPLVQKSRRVAVPAAFACGAGAVFLGAVVAAAGLMFTESNFLTLAGLIVTAHLPVMAIEGVMTVFCVLFLKKVKPEMLAGYVDKKTIRSNYQGQHAK
jgi:cobalt/nickel transport system permease protein